LSDIQYDPLVISHLFLEIAIKFVDLPNLPIKNWWIFQFANSSFTQKWVDLPKITYKQMVGFPWRC